MQSFIFTFKSFSSLLFLFTSTCLSRPLITSEATRFGQTVKEGSQFGLGSQKPSSITPSISQFANKGSSEPISIYRDPFADQLSHTRDNSSPVSSTSLTGSGTDGLTRSVDRPISRDSPLVPKEEAPLTSQEVNEAAKTIVEGVANNPDDFPARMLKRDKRGVGAAVESFIQHDVDQKKLDLQQAFIQARALGRLDHQGDLYGNAIDWTNFIYWATDPAVKEPTAELSELRTVCETYLEQISKDPQLKSDIRAVAGIALKTEPRTPEEVYATRIAYAGLTDAERAKKAQQALAVTSSKAKTSGQPLLYPLPRPDEVNPPLKTKIPPIITKNAKALRSDSFSFDVGAGVEDDEGEISPLLFKVRGTRDEPFLRNLEATHKRHQDLLERVALQKAKDGAKAAEAKAVAARAEAEATKSPQAETAAVKAEAEAAKANTEALRTESAQTKASALAHPRTQNPSQTRPESLTNNKPQELPLPEQSTTSNTLSNDPASKKAVPRLTKAFNVGRNGILPDLSFSSEAGRLLARPLVKPGSGEPVIKALPLPSRSKPDPATPLAQSSTSSTHSVVPEPVIKPLPLPLPLHNSIRQSVSPLGRFSNLPIAQKASSTIHSSVKQTSG